MIRKYDFACTECDFKTTLELTMQEYEDMHDEVGACGMCGGRMRRVYHIHVLKYPQTKGSYNSDYAARQETNKLLRDGGETTPGGMPPETGE